MKRTKIERCISFAVLTVCLLKAISYGSTKNTNAAPSVLTAIHPRLAPQALLSKTQEPLVPPLNTYHLSLNTIAPWTARGAYCDWQPIDLPDTFRFPVGLEYIPRITVMAWGEVRCPSKGDATFLSRVTEAEDSSFSRGRNAASPLATLPQRVSIEPNISTVSHGLTPSNSYLIAWQNACVERSATNRVNAAIELFPNGSIATVWQPLSTPTPPTYTYFPAVPPENFPGHGQDADWIRATFPDEADAILAQGYDDWLLNDYVGINAENGHALIRVTIDPSAFNQAPSTTNQQPIYLACGRYRVNVAEPGTYAFPLEVLTSCEVRTYPTPIPLAFDFDDGYRGDNGPSFEVADLNHPAPRPMMLKANPIDGLRYIYDFFMTPKIVAVPNSVPLQYAVGTKFDLFCNAVRQGDYTFSEVNGTLIEILTRSKAEIREAQHAELVQIRSRAFDQEMYGWFEITGSFPTNELGFITNRVDAAIFYGDTWHTESLGNRRASHHLTAVTQHGSTEPVTVARTHAMAEGQSAYVAVYMASTETRSNPAYDDSVSWCVTANSGGELSGSANLFAQMDSLSSNSSWEHELYGIRRDPLFLCGAYFAAPSDDVLRLSLTATAQNATDGLRETCVQIIVYPVDANGNPIGLPTWAQ